MRAYDVYICYTARSSEAERDDWEHKWKMFKDLTSRNQYMNVYIL